MIKTVHQIWLGPAPMPENYQEFRQRWQGMNPEWEFKLWTEKEIDAEVWDNQQIYDAVAIPPEGKKTHDIALATQRSDIIRYEILYRYGGMYLDCDIEPIQSLSYMFNLFPDSTHKAVASYENTHFISEPLPDGTTKHGLIVNNNFMWSPEVNMDIWKKCIDKISLSFDKALPIPTSTGPNILSNVSAANPNDIYIYPYEVFNSIPFYAIGDTQDAPYTRSSLSGQVVGIHHYGHRKNGRPQYSWTD